MKPGVIKLMFVIIIALVLSLPANARAAWFMILNCAEEIVEPACPQGLNLVSVVIDEEECFACIPPTIQTNSDKEKKKPNEGPHEGVPQDKPHFEGAI